MHGSNNMEKKIKELILGGDFLEAGKYVAKIDFTILRNILLDIGYNEESICAYSFVCFLILEKETVQYHCLASEILNNAFPHLVGGYESSMYHIKRSLELCPDNVELKENLLFFNDIPQKLLSDEEAKKVSKEILQKKPDSKVAIRI
jgi:hypothetical protein